MTRIHSNPKGRIMAHIQAHRFESPSVDNIAAACGISHAQTHRYLRQLLDDGLLCQINRHYYPAGPEDNSAPEQMSAEQMIDALQRMGYEVCLPAEFIAVPAPDHAPAETTPDLPAPNPLD